MQYLKRLPYLMVSFGSLGALVFATSCASTPTPPQQTRAVSAQNQQAARELGGDIVSTIIFKPGVRRVPAGAATELEGALNEARQLGEIASIDVAVWSDLRYPEEGKKLPQPQVDLAEARGQNIEKYIARHEPNVDVQIHNMAKHPSALSELLRTRDASVKEKLVAMGLASPTKGELEDRSSSAMLFIRVRQ